MSFVSSRGSWSSGFSGFGLSRPSSDPAELMYQSYKQLGKDLADGGCFSAPETTSLWVRPGTDTVAPKPLRLGAFANQYVSVLGALPTIDTGKTSRTLFGDEVPNSRLMQGLNKSYTGLSTREQPQFLLRLKTNSPEIHQAFVEWNLRQSGLPHNNGLNPARFSCFAPSLSNDAGRIVQLQMWLNSLNSPHPAQFRFLQNLSQQLNGLYGQSDQSEETLSRLIKPLVPWVGEQGAKDLVQIGEELFGDRPPVSGSTLPGRSKASASNMSTKSVPVDSADVSPVSRVPLFGASKKESVPVHSAAMRPPVVGFTPGDGSKAAASNKTTVVTRRPGLNINVFAVSAGVKQVIPAKGHIAVSKLAHQLIDAYEKRFASISVDVNKIRRDREMLSVLADKWQALEPNLAATMRRLADHDSFDDSIRLNIDIQYGGSDHRQPPSSRTDLNLRELGLLTTHLDPSGAYTDYVMEGDFANDRLDLESWVPPRNAEPIEINLDSDFGRGLQSVLNFIGETCDSPRTAEDWQSLGKRLELLFVSPECQNWPEIWDAALSLRQLASGDETNSLVSDAFSLGFMTNKVVSILNSQPKPSPFVRRNSVMTPPPESAVAAVAGSGFVSQDPVFGLDEGSPLREVVLELLPLVDDHGPEGRTGTQWRELGVRVGQKFIEGLTSKNEIFQLVKRLYDFVTASDEDPDIWGPLLDGIFSVDGVEAEYDRMKSGAGSSGTSTPRSVLEVVSTPAAAGSRSLGNPLIQPVFHAGDGDDDGPLDEAATLRDVRRYINGSDDDPTEPIDWRAVGRAFRARVDELFYLNSPLSPSANLAIIQLALADIEDPSQDTKDFLAGYSDAGSCTNYDHQIDELGSRSSGIEVNDSGEHGEISGRNSQLNSSPESSRSTSPMAQRTLGSTARPSLFDEGDDDLSGSSEEFVPGFESSINSLSPGVVRDVVVHGPQVNVGRPFGRSGPDSGSRSERFAAVQRNLDADFKEEPDVVRLPGENPGLSALAIQATDERGSQFKPLSRVKTEGRIGDKDGVESDAESDDSGFRDGLGRNQQERLTGGDGMIDAGSPNTIAAEEKQRRMSWIPNLGLLEFIKGTKQEPENGSAKGKRASLSDADLGRESRETVEMTPPRKKPGDMPRLPQDASHTGIELRSSLSWSGSNDSKNDLDDEL